jgi:hypothetical protein
MNLIHTLERPLPQENTLIQEPPLQHNAHRAPFGYLKKKSVGVCFLHFKALSGQIQQINKGIWSAEIISKPKNKKRYIRAESTNK